MKLLLTSLGLSTEVHVDQLEALLGKPLGVSTLMYVPTALHATPGGASAGYEMLSFARPQDWASVGFLELTALTDVPPERWQPDVEAADALMVGGGNTPYLSHWLQRSDFAGLLPQLLQRSVYIGVSAGSIVAGTTMHINAARLRQDGIYDDDIYGDDAPAGAGSSKTLELVPFAVRPHLNSPDLPRASLEQIASTVTGPTYAIDDQTAIVVEDDVVTPVGNVWHFFP